jgi:cobyrinic acid a,c-diamide synthase
VNNDDVNMNTRYLEFTEKNEHEGETWRYWLQVAGNEEELDKLREFVDSEQEKGDFPYTLGEGTVPPDEVFALVKHTMCGYTYFENVCVGTFTMPEVVPFDPDNDGEPNDDDPFYKGGIKDCFTS